MRKIGVLLSLISIMILMTTSLSFGALELESSYPEDGGEDYQSMNFAVKLYFNQDVKAEENLDAVHMYDSKNRIVSSRLVYSNKETGLALVVVDGDLKENSEYKLIVDDTFQSASGELLGVDKEINFKTRDMSKDATVNMVLMGGMMVAVIVLTTRTMKKDKNKPEKDKKEENKVNPYKVAKEKGKSVEEIVAQDLKAKEKAALAAAKEKALKEKEIAKILGEERKGVKTIKSDWKKVKAPRPVSAGGSTYKSGTKKKAEAEAKSMAEKKAAGTTNPKKGKSKAKNKNK